jgi:anti-sigma regulatory factor (Ser/Thr protein kinase)
MLDAADRVLRSQTPDRFVTAWVGVFDPLWSTLACASAGHPAPLRRAADGTVATLPAGGLPLGLRERGTDVTRHLELSEGSTLLLYTDGLIEAGRDVLAGEAALVEALRAVDVAREPARTIHRAVLAGTGASDDVALLVVTFGRSLLALRGDVALRWAFDAHDGEQARAVRQELVERLARHGVGDADRVMAELVYAELIGNVARYAPGQVELALDLSGEYAVLHVIDGGAGFQHNPRLPADALAESGRGLYIVSSIADEFSVTRCAGGGAHARAVLKGRLAQARAMSSLPIG